MAVELQIKRCCHCKQEKPASEFYKNHTHKTGLCSRCKVCQALRKKQLAARPPIHVDQKVCHRCKQRKAASEFGKDVHQRDGLACKCKECERARTQERREQHKYIPTTQVCSQCGIEKAAHEFNRDRLKKSGLQSWCKECNKLSARARVVTKRCTTKEAREEWNALSSWQQVPDLLREMAELQLSINNLNAECERRVAMIQKEIAAARLPYIMRQTKLHFMLEGFIGRDRERFLGIRKGFAFGTVVYSGRKLAVHLNTQFAALKLGQAVSRTALIG